MNFKRYLVVLGVLAGVAALSGSAANATHSWGNYHWARTSNSFVLNLGDNVSSAWDSYLGGASSDWSASSVLDTSIGAGGTNNTKGKYTPKNCVPTSGRVEVCSAKYGANGWLGLAQIWVSGNHIVQGTAKVNDTYFNTAKYSPPAWKKLVMCQEISHTFGLDHQDETFNNVNLGSCTDYTNAPAGGVYNGFNYGPSNEHPNAHDFGQLEIIYAHLDSTATLGQTTSSGSGKSSVFNGVDGREVAEWGKSIRTSSDGKPSLFEGDLGNGNKGFTFVILAN